MHLLSKFKGRDVTSSYLKSRWPTRWLLVYTHVSLLSFYFLAFCFLSHVLFPLISITTICWNTTQVHPVNIFTKLLLFFLFVQGFKSQTDNCHLDPSDSCTSQVRRFTNITSVYVVKYHFRDICSLLQSSNQVHGLETALEYKENSNPRESGKISRMHSNTNFITAKTKKS